MKWMSSEIQVGGYIFRNRTNAVQIKKSRKEMTGTATITLPNLKGILQREIKAGDVVEVKLGYDDVLYTKFQGYVKEVSPKHPFTLICEDEMWALKQKSITPKSWETVKLKELVEYINPGTNYHGYDITLSPFKIDKTIKSRAEALQKLKEEFGLDIYFRGKQLYVGLAYQEKVGDINYHIQKNVKRDGVDLTFKRKEDMRIKIVAISINNRNEKVEVTGGDSDGETHTLHFYNKTKAELQALINEQLNLMKYDGYRGTFTAMGIPRPLHGMVCHISDARYPQRDGSFFIDSVTIDYGSSSGYQHTVELGRKASA